MDFHILGTADEQVRRVYACRITEKARERGHRVFVRVTDDSEAGELDTLLWTFRDRSFLPHAIDGHGAPEEPVMVGTGDVPLGQAPDVLVNLAPGMPAQPARYTRIVEIGDNQAPVLQAARQRFRAYRDQGMTPEHRPVESA